ncbi:hypothetical protein [Streptomyces sp. NPDC093261]|uniref:hypothetical protein n=1 Tax=Streptomyces sp. NPDC093261 TaxID=3366037 RepID=UPI00382ACF35
MPDTPEPQRFVRYVGQHAKLIVHGIGEWLAGEVKQIEAELAKRLLGHPDFTEHTPEPEARPAEDDSAQADEAPAEKKAPARKSAAARGN